MSGTPSGTSSAASLGAGAASRPVTVRDFVAKKGRGERLVMVTAYDALFGRLVDDGGVDGILVGDSVANVVQGRAGTVAVTLDEMIYHATAVCRGVRRALVVVDLPFLTYQVSVDDALRSSGRVMQATGAGAVKMEGASELVVEGMRRTVELGVPVMAHLGHTPQASAVQGAGRVQGRDANAAARIVDDARRVEDTGAFAVVLELVPAELAARVTEAVRIPTIGIGAGVRCDGQVLVLHDMLGLNDGFTPKFLKRYSHMADEVRGAVRRFGDDVRAGAYPDAAHSF
jgi:3-methyl-2-oxobutanoate hydroxymethyltransferase